MSSVAEPTTCSDPRRTVRRVESLRSFDAEAFRRIRIEAGLSHDALSRLTKRTRPNLISWENGRFQPTPRILVILAGALQVDPFELLTVNEKTATLPDLRARAGLDRGEVAARLGVHRITYLRLEQGRAPLRTETIPTLAALFDTTTTAIVDAYQRAKEAE